MHMYAAEFHQEMALCSSWEKKDWRLVLGGEVSGDFYLLGYALLCRQLLAVNVY